MKKFFQQYQISVSIGIFLVVIVPCAVFGMKMFSERIAQKVQRIQEELVIQESRGERLNNLSQFRSQAEKIRANENLLNIFLAQDDDAKAALARDLEAIADAQQVTIAIKPDDDPRSIAALTNAAKDVEHAIVPAANAFLPLRITAEGEYNDILAFVEKLENVRYASDILSLTLTKQQNVIDNTFNSPAPEDGDVQEPTQQIENHVEAIMTMVFYFDKETATP